MIAAFLVAPAMAARYRQHKVWIVDEFGDTVTNIDSITIFDAGTSTQSTIFGDRAGAISVTNPVTPSSNNSTFDQSLGLIRWFQAAPDFKITVLESGESKTLTLDNQNETNTRFPFYANYIGALSSFNLGDSDNLNFGTDTDWVWTWDNTNSKLTAIPAVDDGAIDIGSTNFTSDLNLFGGTSGSDLKWDASEDTLELLDNTILAVGTGDDWTVSHNGTTTTIAGATTLSGIQTFSTDVIFDSTNNIKFDDSRSQLHFQDNAVLGIGGAADAAGDVTMTHNGTTFILDAAIADQAWTIGDTTTGFDITVAYETAGQIVIDYDGDDILLSDEITQEFGTGGDVTVNFDGSDFKIDAITADEGFLIGDTTTGFDLTYAFETAGQFRTDYDGDFINLTDDMDLRFGTGASADGDFQISSSSGNVLTIGQIVAGTGTIAIGVDDAGIDTTFYGDTTLVNGMWDTDADSWYFTGAATYLIHEGATVDASEHTVQFTDPTADLTWIFPDGATDSFALVGSTLVTNVAEAANSFWGGTNQIIMEGATADGFETILTPNDATADATLAFPDDSGDLVYAPEGVVDYAAGAGALPITHAVITYESTGGAEALTLADGKPGQILHVNHDTDGGNGVITPATALGYTSIDLADDGDMVTFQFVDTQGWIILGTAGNAAPPVVTP